MAPPIAFHLELPFYGKAIPKEGIKQSIEYYFGREDTEEYLSSFIPDKTLRTPKEFLSQWEYGGWEEFIKRYLV